MSVYSDLRYKDKLKQEGHELIEEILSMGVHKNKSYRRMARVLRLPERQIHFSNTQTIKQLEEMITVLTNFRDDIKRHRPRKPIQYRPFKIVKNGVIIAKPKAEPKEKNEPRHKDQVLPRDQYLKAMAEMHASQLKSREPEGAAQEPESTLRRILKQIGVIH